MLNTIDKIKSIVNSSILMGKSILIFSIIFILILFSAHKKASAQQTTTAYAWKGPTVAQQNIIPFCWVSTFSAPPYMYHITDIAGIAAHLQSMPQGKRCIFLFNKHREMENYPADQLKDSVSQQVQGFTDTLSVFHPFPTVWWDSGAVFAGHIHDTLFAGLAAAGALLDMVVLDFEQVISNWTLSHALDDYAINPADEDSILTDYYNAIAADARSSTMFPQLGFTDLLTVKNWYQNGNEYLIFNDYWWGLRSGYIQTAIVNPLHQYYPQAKMSNYGDFYVSADYPVPENNGHEIYCCGNTGTHSGTHQSGVYYGWMGQICTTNPPPGSVGFTCTPYNALLLSCNRMKSVCISSPVPQVGWIAYPGFQDNNSVQFYNSPYYIENIFHLLLSGSDDILFWNPGAPYGPVDSIHSQDAQLVSNALMEFDAYWLNASPDSTFFYPPDTITAWDAPYLLTGMESDSTIVWRFTPRLDSVYTDPFNFLVTSNPLTFNVHGSVLTFPSGAVIDSVNTLSQVGLWIKLNKGILMNTAENTNYSLPYIYPSPATNHFTILLGNNYKKVEVTITDISGKIIYTTSASETPKLKVSTNDLAAGIYLVRIQSETFLKMEKLMVTK